MKKIIINKLLALMIVVSVMMSFQTVSYGKNSVKLKDVQYTDWFKETVGYLVNIGGINGYNDNTFRPFNTITRAEFIKTVVASIYIDKEVATLKSNFDYELRLSEDFWATKYLKKAENSGMIDSYLFERFDYSLEGLNKPIRRGEIAYILMNVEPDKKESYIDQAVFDYDDGYYMYKISDVLYDDAVMAQVEVDCYKYGIVTGYPDGTFRSSNYATRAEAATMIARFLKESYRTEVVFEELPFPVNEFGVPMFRDSAFQRPINYVDYDDPNIIYRFENKDVFLEMVEQIGVQKYEKNNAYHKLFSLKVLGDFAQLEEGQVFDYTGHVKLILAYGVYDVDGVMGFVDMTETYMYENLKEQKELRIKILGKDNEQYIIICNPTKNQLEYIVYKLAV